MISTNVSRNHFKYSLYLLGAFFFAFWAAMFLHELGHVLAIYLTDGSVARIVFEPLSGAVTTYSVRAANPVQVPLIPAGGVLFGSLFAVGMAMPFLSRFRNYWTVPVALVAVSSLALNGLMLVVGTFSSLVGDVNKLLALEVSRTFLGGAGVVMLALSLGLFIRLSPWLGLHGSVPLRERLGILSWALLPYMAAVLVYNAFVHSERLLDFSVYFLAGLGIGLAGLTVCGWLQERVFPGYPVPDAPLKWRHVLYAMLLPAMVILGVYLLGALKVDW